jgi:hypothetical protein
VLSLLEAAAASSEATLTDLGFLCNRAIDQWTAQQGDIADALSAAIETGSWWDDTAEQAEHAEQAEQAEQAERRSRPSLAEHDAIRRAISSSL